MIKVRAPSRLLREFAIVILAVSLPMRIEPALGAPHEADGVLVESPSREVAFHLSEDDGVLRYRITFGQREVIERSRVGILVDGIDLGARAYIDKSERYEIHERYPTRGVHSTARNNCLGAKISLRREDGPEFLLEVRAFDDGVAFRQLVPGTGKRTPDAVIDFRIPAGSTVWYHGLRGHYEGVHRSDPIESLGEGEWVAPPMTFKLPEEAGYGAITEASLVNYAGMVLQSGGDRVIHERLGHAPPAGHPFELRFGQSEAERLSHPAAIEGPILTPWRVVMVGKDLNTLVNCDIVENVSPEPDPALFPQGLHTAWIKPGRCVWKFLDGGTNDLPGMMEFTRMASDLGFEYNLVEGFWQRWSEQDLHSLVDYSRKLNVGVWLWKDSRKLHTEESRQEFFGLCQRVGAVGVKIDFLDHEAKEVIDLYQVLLKEAAQHQLMVDFHGANKPTGETRTWPNELTREGVRGMESSQLPLRSRHDATLPFTRYLAGPADYTPVVFGPRRSDTTVAHQIATAAVFTSPLLVYGGHPKSFLESPAVDMIKSIPSDWDETVVLPVSEIGHTAAFARRHGNQWFLAVVGGPESRKLAIPLSFLDSTAYHGMLVRDELHDPASLVIEQVALSSAASLQIELAEGGGFVGRFTPAVSPVSAAGRGHE